MSDFSPIQPPQRVEPWQRIEPISREEEERKRFQYDQEAAATAHAQAPAACGFSLLIKGLSTLAKKPHIAVFDEEEIKTNLLNFQKYLITLMTEDQSHDPSFTLQFSSVWHKLNENFNTLCAHRGANAPASKAFETLLEEVESYPPWEDHTLGFYLAHHGGENWYPIPFMEILFTLHLEAKSAPAHNMLQTWSSLITSIITFL